MTQAHVICSLCHFWVVAEAGGSRGFHALHAHESRGNNTSNTHTRTHNGCVVLSVPTCSSCLLRCRPHLAKLASGLDVLERVRHANLYHARDSSGEHSFALVLRLQVRGGSHLAAWRLRLACVRRTCACKARFCGRVEWNCRQSFRRGLLFAKL